MNFGTRAKQRVLITLPSFYSSLSCFFCCRSRLQSRIGFTILSIFLIVTLTCIAWALTDVEYTEYQPFQNSDGKNSREQIFEVPFVLWLFNVPDRLRILEIGTGRGIALTPIAQRRNPSRLVGVDISLEALEIARRNLESDHVAGVELVHADTRKLPFEAASFDLLMDFGTLYHIAHQAQALKELARVVAPGAKLITETQFAQFTSHPFRSWGRKIPWDSIPCLRRTRWRLVWEERVNECTEEDLERMILSIH